MKFSTTVATLALAAGALSEPIAKRSLVAFQLVIAGIDADVSAVGSQIASFSATPNAAHATSVQDASNALVTAIVSGVSVANAQPTLADTDALSLVGPIETLRDDVSSVISALVARKTDFAALDSASNNWYYENAVHESLGDQLDATEDLSAAISSKVSSNIAPIASQLSGQIVSAISSGLVAYPTVTA